MSTSILSKACQQRRHPVRQWATALLALVLVACGSGGGDPDPTPGTITYTVGGSLSGLTSAQTVVLQNSGGDNLSLTANGSFTFATRVGAGAAYAVSVLTAPVGAACTVQSGSGTANANVATVAVTCAAISAPTYHVTVNVSGLTGTGLVLRNNGGDDLAIAGNGTATFVTALASGAPYAVTVLTQPSGQTCSATAASGTVAAADVAVALQCTGVAVSGARMFITGGNPVGLRAYVLDATTGLPTLTGTATVSAGGALQNLVLDSTGSFVYFADYSATSSSLWGYAVDAATGGLSAIVNLPLAIGPGPGALAVHPNGRVLYVVQQSGGSTIAAAYAINAATGALTPVSGSSTAALSGVGKLVFDSTGQAAYVLTSGGVLYAFTVNGSSGALTLANSSVLTTAPVTTGGTNLVVHPTGRFVFINSTNGVLVYARDNTSGALTQVSGSPYAGGNFDGTGNYPVLVDSAGAYLYTTTAKQLGQLQAFQINATTGALTLVPGSPFSLGGSEVTGAMVLGPNAGVLYTATRTSNAYGANLMATSLNAGTGVPTLLPGMPQVMATGVVTAYGNDLLRFHPNGKFAYLLSGASPTLSVMGVDTSTGALTATTATVPNLSLIGGGLTTGGRWMEIR